MHFLFGGRIHCTIRRLEGRLKNLYDLQVMLAPFWHYPISRFRPLRGLSMPDIFFHFALKWTFSIWLFPNPLSVLFTNIAGYFNIYILFWKENNP